LINYAKLCSAQGQQFHLPLDCSTKRWVRDLQIS